ncbi:MAG: type II toxin-antitoxin system HicB family antitoxin [bacterium]|nr:type II toxin-antitoxin system HicB family antitoxin [bacterium]
MQLEVILKAGESGYIVAECPALPGCYSQGLTREEAIANITEAILLSLESRRELGLPLPEKDVEVELLRLEVA